MLLRSAMALLMSSLLLASLAQPARADAAKSDAGNHAAESDAGGPPFPGLALGLLAASLTVLKRRRDQEQQREGVRR